MTVELHYNECEEGYYVDFIKLPNGEVIDNNDKVDKSGNIISFKPLKKYINSEVEFYYDGELEIEAKINHVYKDKNGIWTIEYK